MRALVFDKELTFINDYPAPVPGEGESLVRVLAAGICGTDIEIVKGYMGFHGVPGHEFVGIVEETGKEGIDGKRVVGEINAACGTCDYCTSGASHHCPNRTVLGILERDGAFADYLVLPDANLHVVPDSVSNLEAVFTEPLAAAFRILQQVRIDPDSVCVVLGDGRLGLLVAQVLALTGCNLIIYGKHEEKVKKLENPAIEFRPAGAVDKGHFADYVVEATGSPDGLKTALKLIKPRGTLIQKSTFASDASMNISSVVVDEITIVGSRCGPFPPALRALSKKTVNVSPLIERVFPFDQAIEAFRFASRAGRLKVIMDYS